MGDLHFLMCAPINYGVEYVINPWMENNEGKINTDLAMRQWRCLYDRLSAFAKISLIMQPKGLPDMVFTANAGLVLGHSAIVSRFRSKERQGEEPLFKSWFLENGFTVPAWPMSVPFEGAGDALWDGQKEYLWQGSGFRSDPAASDLIERAFGRRVITLRLVDQRFYHLDTCFCPLSDGTTLYYPGAFAPDSLAMIEAGIPAEKRIPVDEEDAVRFACNAVEANKHVFMNDASNRLRNALKEAGYMPECFSLSEFMKAGGGAKCLTLKLS